MARNTLRKASISVLLALLITVCSSGVLLLAAWPTNAAPMIYRSLDYDVSIDRDGDMRIVETVDMRLHEREDDDDNTIPWRQLYQRYTLRSTDVTDITDISVRNLTTGETYAQGNAVDATYVSEEQWGSYENQWYIADVSSYEMEPFDPQTDGLVVASAGDAGWLDRKTVEIGWNIPPTDSARSMVFQLSMTWKNVVTDYQDVAQFQWEPVGESNTVPIGALTATVQLPEGADQENTRAWLHYTGTSSVSRTDSGRTLEFSADDIRSGEYLDLVAMYDVGLSNAQRYVDSAKGRSLIASERAQEDAWREGERKKARTRLIVWSIIGILGIACAVWALWGAIRSRRDSTYHGDIEYWREPLDMSPAAAARMDMMLRGSNGMAMLRNRQLSATLMSLISKGAIAVYPGDQTLYQGMDPTSPAAAIERSRQLAADPQAVKSLHHTNTIVMLPPAFSPDLAPLHLCESERAELELLLQVSKRVQSAVFDMNQMKDALTGWKKGIRYLNEFTAACQHEVNQLKALRSTGLMYGLPAVILLCIAIASCIYFTNMRGQWALSLLFSVPCIFIGVFTLFYGSSTALTDPRGQEIAGRVLGLRRYLKDFSAFRDRGSADLPLWGRYLVYATAFGMSRRALKEFAAANMRASDDDAWSSDMMGVMFYWSLFPSRSDTDAAAAMAAGAPSDSAFAGSFDFGGMFTSSMNSITSTIQAAAPSSSGSSGSFSSGGGFGGIGGGAGGGSFGGR